MNSVLLLVALAGIAAGQLTTITADGSDLIGFDDGVICGDANNTLDLSSFLDGPGCDADPFLTLTPEGACASVMDSVGNLGCELTFGDLAASEPEFNRTAWTPDGAAGMIAVPANLTAYGLAAATPYPDFTFATVSDDVVLTDFTNAGNLVGFVDAGATLLQKILLRGDPSVDEPENVVAAQNNDYTFAVDVCGDDAATTATLTALITTDVAINTGIASSGPAAATEFSVDGDVAAQADGNLTCTSLDITIPHYELFGSLGVNGLTFSLTATGGRVFVANPTLTVTERVNLDNLDDPASPCSQIFISEVSYIGDSMTNELERIEIVGPPGTPLTGFTIELVDFDGAGVDTPYLTLSFDTIEATPQLRPSGTTTNDGQFGFFVVEFPSTIQDGDDGVVGVDGIRLLSDGNVLQFLCYGPNVTTAMLGVCDNAVDANGIAQLDNGTIPDSSVALFGCGFCREHFDYAFTATANFGADDAETHFFCRDLDLDGFWDGNSTAAFNQAGLNKTAGEGVSCCGGNDCQNFYNHIFPGADEICDGFDSNCDGGADDLPDEVDRDLDGRIVCDGDCLDSEPTVFGASEFVTDNIYGLTGNEGIAQVEICDTFDNDCNDIVNDPEIFGDSVIHFEDLDGDGFADAGLLENETTALEFPNCMVINETDCATVFPVFNGVFYAQQRLDCNDTDFSIRPDGFGTPNPQFANGTAVPADFCNRAEICDLVDQNCNQQVDEGLFEDNDLDGFDVLNSTDCFDRNIRDRATLGTDCDDTVFEINPNANETCDKIDNNCNDLIDENLFNDTDGDGFSAENVTECIAAYGAFFVGTDCNDTNADINPSAREILCDGIDNDCDQEFPQLGLNTNDTFPEVCDGLDSDCDGDIDNGFVTDLDGDGFFAFVSDAARDACEGALNRSDPLQGELNLTAPQSTITTDPNPPVLPYFEFEDCNDDTNQTHPGFAEICDGIDNDCLNGTDGGAVDPDTGNVADNGLIFDDDNDGRLRGANSFDAGANPGRVSPAECFGTGSMRKRQLTFVYLEDCNDADEDLLTFSNNVTSGDQPENSCDGVDDNCNGQIDELLFVDNDGDGFSDPSSTGLNLGDDSPLDCAKFYDAANIRTDCNDGNDDINPDAEEVPCDNIDNDCNDTTGVFGGLNDRVVGGLLTDADSDGVVVFTEPACADFITLTDCNDLAAEQRPCIPGNEDDLVDADGNCLRELQPEFRGDGFGDNIDNDCNLIVDDIIKDTIELSLSGEIIQVTSTVGDDDSDDSTSASTDDEDDDDCTNLVIAVTLEVRSKFDDIVPTNVIVKGQLTLPSRAVVDDYVMGDLTNFGIKIDRNSNRVTWVQFQLNRQQQVHIPICLKRLTDAPDVGLTLAVESVDQQEVVPANTLTL